MNQPKHTSDIVDKLKQASDGLQYMSESDYPFDVFQWVGQESLTGLKRKWRVNKGIIHVGQVFHVRMGK